MSCCSECERLRIELDGVSARLAESVTREAKTAGYLKVEGSECMRRQFHIGALEKHVRDLEDALFKLQTGGDR